MAEALRIAPKFPDSVTPEASAPQIVGIPYYLRRRTLRQVERENGAVINSLWDERADRVEKKVQSTIASQTELVRSATINPPYTKGSDIIVEFVDGFPIEKVVVEVKSSTVGIRDYKQKIRNSLPRDERDMDHVRVWMAENKTILINGGEKDGYEKSPQEILDASFYPQLKRIMHKVLDGLMSAKFKRDLSNLS